MFSLVVLLLEIADPVGVAIKAGSNADVKADVGNDEAFGGALQYHLH